MDDVTITATSSTGKALLDLLATDEIEPGSEPSYQIVKIIYTFHPLGAKIAEAPISMAQSQERTVTVQDAPKEVLAEFKKHWKLNQADDNIHNVMSLKRVYGLASIILGCKEVPSDKPIDMTTLWDKSIFFNVLDPLNTAGSLVLNQIPTASDFNKPATVRVNGQTYHPSRFQVVMNEHPIYLEYNPAAFGFVGRSVYQRVLYPLKGFILTMVANNMIAQKLGLLVVKQKSSGSVVTNIMQKLAGIKRFMLKQGHTNQVLGIGTEESIETLNMMNVDGAGTFARTNILKDIATGADMPAKLLENETMVAGFGEGTEDAKNIARYIERIRMQMDPVYNWFDNIVQYRAWSPPFFKRMQAKYPERYKDVTYDDAFSEWRANFQATWPSLLIEPESEQSKIEGVKLEAAIAVLQTLLPELDPANKALLIESALANIGENKRLFAHDFALDYDALLAHLIENADRAKQQTELGESEEKPDGVADKVGKFDSARLSTAIARLPQRNPKRITAAGATT
jgi:Anti-CBASS protein Acb1-like